MTERARRAECQPAASSPTTAVVLVVRKTCQCLPPPQHTHAKQLEMAKDPSKKKDKKKGGSSDAPGSPAHVRPRILIPIAHPLADDKLSKKVLKMAKRAAKRKQIKRGVKEVVKALRKGGATG